MALDLTAASSLAPAERAALFTAGYEGYLLPFQVDEPTLLFMEHAFDLDPEASLVASVEGERVGLANLGLRGADGWVGGIGIVPGHRGSGRGEALMLALIDAARARGVERLWLEVIVENTAALRLYEKLGFAHVRELEVWSLEASTAESSSLASADALGEAHDRIRARRDGREPWQRSDETLARLAGLEPAPAGVLVEGGAAAVRVNQGRVNVVQLAAESHDACLALLGALRGVGAVSILNLPAGDPAAAAFEELGGTVAVRQHEMVLEL